MNKFTYKPWSSIILEKNSRKLITDSIDNFKKSSDIFKTRGWKHKFNILLKGYAGTGKTSIINAIASQYSFRGANMFDRKCDYSDISSYFEHIDGEPTISLPSYYVLSVLNIEKSILSINKKMKEYNRSITNAEIGRASCRERVCQDV